MLTKLKCEYFVGLVKIWVKSLTTGRFLNIFVGLVNDVGPLKILEQCVGLAKVWGNMIN